MAIGPLKNQCLVRRDVNHRCHVDFGWTRLHQLPVSSAAHVHPPKWTNAL